MHFIGNLEHPKLKRFLRNITAGEHLFKAGDEGQLMYIVLHGIIGLYDVHEGKERLIGTVGTGQVLGEQAIVREPPYHRVLTAQAIVDTKLLEMGVDNIGEINQLVPDFTLRILQITAKWLDRANRLLHVLRPTDRAERLVQGILFSIHEKGTQSPDGVQVKLTVDALHYITQVTPEEITQCLALLEEKKCIEKKQMIYFISDPTTLRDHLPALRKLMNP